MFVGCGKTEELPTQANVVTSTEGFFNVSQYFSQESSRLIASNTQVAKAVSFGKNTEKIPAALFDSTEFQIFIQSDINRNAWLDKFSVDTFQSNAGYVVTYNRLSNTIPVKQLAVEFSKADEVTGVKIETKRNSLLYKSEQVMSYVPNVSYAVKGWQKTLMMHKTEFEVNGYFEQANK